MSFKFAGQNTLRYFWDKVQSIDKMRYCGQSLVENDGTRIPAEGGLVVKAIFVNSNGEPVMLSQGIDLYCGVYDYYPPDTEYVNAGCEVCIKSQFIRFVKYDVTFIFEGLPTFNHYTALIRTEQDVTELDSDVCWPDGGYSTNSTLLGFGNYNGAAGSATSGDDFDTIALDYGYGYYLVAIQVNSDYAGDVIENFTVSDWIQEQITAINSMVYPTSAVPISPKVGDLYHVKYEATDIKCFEMWDGLRWRMLKNPISASDILYGTISADRLPNLYSAGTGLSLNGREFALATSGVSAGSYGPSADVTGNNNTTINVPYITVDAYGRVTAVSNKVYTSKNNTYSNMTAATADAAGAAGLVPAPAKGKQASFLRGDGTWVVPTNTTYSAGTGLSLSSTTFSLATSGATAGSYGPSADVTGNNNTTINVPYITVDKYGRVTAISNKTYTSKNTTYSAMTGATADDAGAAGLVPKPAAGKQAAFLRGDGTWTNDTSRSIVKVQTTKRDLIVKYGDSGGTAHHTDVDITFPTAFPSACIGVLAICKQGTYSAPSTITVNDYSKTGFTIHQSNSASATMSIHWIAFGY